MARQFITINGITVGVPDGAQVSVENNTINVNGDQVGRFEGDSINIQSCSARFDLHCDKDVRVDGDVTGKIDAKGMVICDDVVGPISCTTIECDDVTGPVNCKGDVNCGNIMGPVMAQRVRN